MVKVFNWRMAEELAAEHLRQLGFSSVKRMPDGADGGVDVAGDGVSAQVKHWSQPVGISEIQRFRGTRLGGETLVFYSKSGYTRQAIEFAGAGSIALFEYGDASAINACNDAASHLNGNGSSALQPMLDEVQRSILRLKLAGSAFHAMMQVARGHLVHARAQVAAGAPLSDIEHRVAAGLEEIVDRRSTFEEKTQEMMAVISEQVDRLGPSIATGKIKQQIELLSRLGEVSRGQGKDLAALLQIDYADFYPDENVYELTEDGWKQSDGSMITH